MVPSPDWFIYAFVRKEAVISSQIEGTQATLIDLFEYEAEQTTRVAATTYKKSVTIWMQSNTPERRSRRSRAAAFRAIIE